MKPISAQGSTLYLQVVGWAGGRDGAKGRSVREECTTHDMSASSTGSSVSDRLKFHAIDDSAPTNAAAAALPLRASPRAPEGRVVNSD